MGGMAVCVEWHSIGSPQMTEGCNRDGLAAVSDGTTDDETSGFFVSPVGGVKFLKAPTSAHHEGALLVMKSPEFRAL